MATFNEQLAQLQQDRAIFLKNIKAANDQALLDKAFQGVTITRDPPPANISSNTPVDTSLAYATGQTGGPIHNSARDTIPAVPKGSYTTITGEVFTPGAHSDGVGAPGAQNGPSVASIAPKPAEKKDWRVKLSLAKNSTYLYNAPEAGILAPLTETDGIIFPFTPSIDQVYDATYEEQVLTHSDYKSYFYKNSAPGPITVTATFTANSTAEATYLLAVMHFFKSATKMFYGGDDNKGAPPPVCFLSGFGKHQYNDHPVLIQQYMCRLPDNVDYIAAGTIETNSDTSLQARTRPERFNHTSFSRLMSSGLFKGADKKSATHKIANYSIDEPTYVPTKVDITLQLLPMQNRKQMSTEFSLRDFASGALVGNGNKGYY